MALDVEDCTIPQAFCKSVAVHPGLRLTSSRTAICGAGSSALSKRKSATTLAKAFSWGERASFLSALVG